MPERPARSRAADIAALGAILIAGALSAFWAFFIPIFQALDEPAHFDYAASIYGAGRLLARGDGSPSWIASPYAAYLLRASDFNRIAGHSPMRVAPGYGNHSYYAALDAAAPSVHAPQPPHGKTSYVLAAYPFGFYALEALWMHAVAFLTDSLTTLFFAARLLCTAMLMVGLYFNYRTALRLGVPPAASAALIAAIGIFPLTSVVSSYVQPDNLAYALVSAALFFTTRLRDESPCPWLVAPLGFVLGALAVTKYQFFVSVALPAALLLVVALVRAKPGAARAFASLAMLLVPALVLCGIQHWVVDVGTVAGQTAPEKMHLNYLSSVAVNGPEAALRYIVSSVSGAFVGCFISGICAAGYWGVVGWADTPIVIGAPLLQELLRAAISLITLIVAAVVLFYCARNAIRLLAAAARKHPRAAARIVAADPVIISYLLFAAIIVALYVATNNVFGVSGRHWYPYIFPAFLCLVWYAPRSLFGRRQRVSTIAACVLLAYSAVAASYALAGAEHRYYGPQTANYVASDPPRATTAGTALGVQWPLADGTYVFAPSPGKFTYDRGTPVALDGMAMRGDGTGAPDVAALLDGRQPVGVLTRQYLFGIAEATHSIAAGYSGFGGYIATERLAEGPHTVTAYARTGAGGYQIVNPTRLFFVTASQGRLSPAFLRALPRSGALGSRVAADACRGTASTTADGVTTVAGSIVLLSGSLARERAPAALWLLADGRPYPAKYDPGSRAFFATLPTTTLAPGRYDAAFYASEIARDTLVATIRLRVLASNAPAPFVAKAPAECADPLKELAETSS